jgi:hypothetical protein
LLGEVVHVPVALSADRNLLLIAHDPVTSPNRVSRSFHYHPSIYTAKDEYRGSDNYCISRTSLQVEESL